MFKNEESKVNFWFLGWILCRQEKSMALQVMCIFTPQWPHAARPETNGNWSFLNSHPMNWKPSDAPQCHSCLSVQGAFIILEKFLTTKNYQGWEVEKKGWWWAKDGINLTVETQTADCECKNTNDQTKAKSRAGAGGRKRMNVRRKKKKEKGKRKGVHTCDSRTHARTITQTELGHAHLPCVSVDWVNQPNFPFFFSVRSASVTPWRLPTCSSHSQTAEEASGQ